jgi:CRISPR type III-associated protein (TIGR04423 family)
MSKILDEKYTYDDKNKLVEDMKQLQGYEGYIQFSDTKIRDCDIFQKSDAIATKLQTTNGFVYEAHFCNGTESIAIKQINDGWLVSTTSLSKVKNQQTDIQTYHAINGLKVKMAQIWEVEEDEFCEDMKVLKLKKVVFAGFAKGDDK